MANTLCRHFADGRLNEEELNERLARVAAAKTRSELRPPLADLPRFGGDVAQPRPRGRRWSSVVVGVVAVLLVVWSTTGALATLIHPHVPWVLVAIVALLFLRGPRHRRRSRGEPSA